MSVLLFGFFLFIILLIKKLGRCVKFYLYFWEKKYLSGKKLYDCFVYVYVLFFKIFFERVRVRMTMFRRWDF